MKTVKAIRAAFWEQHPEFKPEFRTQYRQNDYRTDIRISFCDFVDHLEKDGQITEKLASRVTL